MYVLNVKNKYDKGLLNCCSMTNMNIELNQVHKINAK